MTRCEAYFRPRGPRDGRISHASRVTLGDVSWRSAVELDPGDMRIQARRRISREQNCAILSNLAVVARCSERATNAVHAGGRAPRDEASACSDRRGIFREKYWQPRERSGVRTTTATEASRRDYVPSWMLPDCRRPGPNYTCSNYGGLPRKEQAIRREPQRRLLCVKGAPRCGGARSCAPAADARPMRVKLRAHDTRHFEPRRETFAD